MNELVNEVLSLAEGNAKWLDAAARHFEHFATQLAENEKAQLDLLAAVYRERAQTIQDTAQRVRQSLITNSSSGLRTEDA
jgi:ABC-type transporter Mla subunit MlaD